MKKYSLFWVLILCLIFVAIPSHVVAQFPNGHPDTSFSSTFTWGYGSATDQFYIYVWRENYSVWIEIEPIGQDEPFICSSSFFIIQNNVQFDTVKLVSVSGDSQCGDVHVPSVFELSQWLFIDNPADLNYDFTLLFDGGENTYTLDIVYNTKPPIANAGDDRTVSEGVTVTLDASNCSDPDNDPISMIWTQTGGPDVNLSDETVEKPTFVAPSYVSWDDILTFVLTVEDGTFRTSDEVSITVAEARPLSSSVSGGDGGGGGCFIATAAYGSKIEPHVKILREFRDCYLLGNTIGDSFIRFYCKYSPPIADFIEKHDNLKSMVRISLLPIVGMSWIILKIGPMPTLGLILSLFLGIFLIRFIGFRKMIRNKWLL